MNEVYEFKYILNGKEVVQYYNTIEEANQALRVSNVSKYSINRVTAPTTISGQAGIIPPAAGGYISGSAGKGDVLGPPMPTTSTDSTIPLTKDQQTIKDLTAQLEAYTDIADRAAGEKAAGVERGLSTLKSLLSEANFSDKQINQIVSSSRGWLNEGYSATEVIDTKISSLAAYKERFPANAIREKNNLPLVSMSSYLAYEASYASLLMAYEDILPKNISTRDANGNFKLPKDLVTSWVSETVSAAEAENRFKIVDTYVGNLNPYIKESLNKYYNIDDKDIAKIVLYKASQQSEKDLGVTLTGAEALSQGLQDVSLNLLQEITGKGIRTSDSAKAFSNVARQQDTYNLLGAIQGVDLTQNDLAASELNLNAEATKKTSAIKEKETSIFGTTSGGQNLLGTSTTGMI